MKNDINFWLYTIILYNFMIILLSLFQFFGSYINILCLDYLTITRTGTACTYYGLETRWLLFVANFAIGLVVIGDTANIWILVSGLNA